MVKRNDVVMFADERMYRFYGRVIRKVGTDRVLWICCGLHFHLSKIEDLVVDNDYKGYLEYSGHGDVVKYFERDGMWNTDVVKFERPKRFIRMTTLRKLKQRATQYHGRNVWRTPLDYEFLQVHE